MSTTSSKPPLPIFTKKTKSNDEIQRITKIFSE